MYKGFFLPPAGSSLAQPMSFLISFTLILWHAYQVYLCSIIISMQCAVKSKRVLNSLLGGGTAFHQRHNLPPTAHNELTQEQECIRNTCCTALSPVTQCKSHFHLEGSFSTGQVAEGLMCVVFSQHLIQMLVGRTEHKSFTLATPMQLHK